MHAMVGTSLTLLCPPYKSESASRAFIFAVTHSWRVHVPVSNVTLGAIEKRDGDQPQGGCGRVVAG
jgi:hypothetical protein